MISSRFLFSFFFFSLLSFSCFFPSFVLAQQPSLPFPSTPSPAPENTLPLKSADGNTDFASAHPEDITNENFPKKIKSFDYPNADLVEVIKAISKLTGKNFIIDPSLRNAKITIIAPSEITVAEAYKAFLSALAMNQYTVVPSGRFLKIRPIPIAKQDSIETYAGDYFPDSDQLITRIIKLKYINATEVEKQLRALSSKGGEVTSYGPTNSLIITDLGSNVERVANIIEQLDVPGFEEKLVVIPILHANARDIAELLTQIIAGGQRGRTSRRTFSSGTSRFRQRSQPAPTSSSSKGSGAASYSLVIPDNRTNSIIVVGNRAGITRIRGLVKKLDTKLRPEDAGGVYVYYLRHNLAERVARVLNGLAAESSQQRLATTRRRSPRGGLPARGAPPTPTQGVFGGDVKVTPDKENNSLIITASKQDYEVVQDLLSKIDIPRDQVFVKTIIMEMNANKTTDWGINYYQFADEGKGIGRIGFRGSDNTDFLNPTKDQGAVIGFGEGKLVTVNVGGLDLEIPSLSGLVKFLKTNNGGNILSTPQITALDNEEAVIEVGERVPVSQSTTQTQVGGTLTAIQREDVTIELKITPFISPDTDTVKMKISQKVNALSNTQVRGNLGNSAIATTKRLIQTSIVVDSGDTAVLGGLMTDEETDQVAKIPILGDIPILGWLFKSKTKQKQKRNLLVFITPKILRNRTDSADLLGKKLDDRINFIRTNMGGIDPHGEIIDSLPRKDRTAQETGELFEEPLEESEDSLFEEETPEENEEELEDIETEENLTDPEASEIGTLEDDDESLLSEDSSDQTSSTQEQQDGKIKTNIQNEALDSILNPNSDINPQNQQ